MFVDETSSNIVWWLNMLTFEALAKRLKSCLMITKRTAGFMVCMDTIEWSSPARMLTLAKRTKITYQDEKCLLEFKFYQTRPNTIKHDQTRSNTTKHDQTRSNTTKHDQTRPNTIKHDQTRPNTTKHDQTRPNTIKHDQTWPKGMFVTKQCVMMIGHQTFLVWPRCS